MPTKILPGQEPKKDPKKSKEENPDKPNVREYCNENKTKDGEEFTIEKCKLTQSGWLIVETEEWVGFIHAKSAVAKNLMETIAPGTHNKKGFAIVAVRSKRNKYGFVLGVNNEIERWYFHDTEANTLELTEEEPDSFLPPSGMLSLDDIFGTK